MRRWFADSFYFFALLSTKDESHARVTEMAGRSPARLVTTEWVLAELADGFAKPDGRVMAAAFIRALQADPNVTIVPTDAGLFEAGLSYYESRADKAWSLTDCISFVVMRHHGIHDALTGDHHFQQAGFNALLL